MKSETLIYIYALRWCYANYHPTTTTLFTRAYIATIIGFVIII